MKKALIVQGGWDGHEPLQVSQVFKEILQEENYEVTVSNSLDSFSNINDLKKLDLIVPEWTMGEIDGQYVNNVCEAVESGVGLAGCHGGMCDSFRNNTEWQFLTGGQWVSHPGGDGIEYMVNIAKDSELLKGMKDFKVSSEQYYVHVDPANVNHAFTTFPIAEGAYTANGKVEVPLCWTRLWGLGKVFYTSLGHVANVFDVPEAKEMMRRGFLWATKGTDGK